MNTSKHWEGDADTEPPLHGGHWEGDADTELPPSWRQTLVLGPLPDLALCTSSSFIWIPCHILQQAGKHVSLSSVSSSSKLIESQEDMWKPLIYSQPVRSMTSGTWDWHPKWAESCGTEPLTSGLRHCLQEDGARIEFSCGMSRWCRREPPGVGTPTLRCHSAVRGVVV